VCLSMYEQHRADIALCAGNAGHCRMLRDLGMENDIDYCLTPDSVDALPVYEDGRIRLLKG
jgi:2-phosphosulfolactate phosphatase